MAIGTVTIDLTILKRAKNAAIGNPHAKADLARKPEFLQPLIDCLNAPLPHAGTSAAAASADELRIEAANIVSSLAHGSDISLQHLLRLRTHEALVYALNTFTPHTPRPLRTAFTRALRTLATSTADVIGPDLWGLRAENTELRKDAKPALAYFFQVEVLDVYLPLLLDPSPQISVPVAQMLAACLRTPAAREAVAGWMPAQERAKDVKGKGGYGRGWEKPPLTDVKSGGWVARTLVELVQTKDPKVQEAMLSTLAALTTENPALAVVLAKSPPDRNASSTLSAVIGLTKSRSTDVQLAACLCATRIIRANPLFTPLPGLPAHENSSALTVMHVLDRIIINPTEPAATRSRACFTLYFLISDDMQLCHTVFEQGVLAHLVSVLHSITPALPSQSTSKTPILAPEYTWDEGEPAGMALLREAALTAVAATCLFDNAIRRAATDSMGLMSILQTGLQTRRPGVRVAACQCVRALSRTVAVVKTSLVDSGLGLAVVDIALPVTSADKMDVDEYEDRRVVCAALAAVCNLVADFSPLREVVLQRARLQALVRVLRGAEPSLRLNALWAVKNLLYKANGEVKSSVMEVVEWPTLARLLTDPDPALQEQTFNVLKNLADKEADIELVVRALGADVLRGALALALESAHEDVRCQAMHVLAHLANGAPAHQSLVFALLERLRACLAAPRVELRRPAVACVLQLAKSVAAAQSPSPASYNPSEARYSATAYTQLYALKDTLRQMCEPASHSPGGRAGTGMLYVATGGGGMEQDREVREHAREALKWISQCEKVL